MDLLAHGDLGHIQARMFLCWPLVSGFAFDHSRTDGGCVLLDVVNWTHLFRVVKIHISTPCSEVVFRPLVSFLLPHIPVARSINSSLRHLVDRHNSLPCRLMYSSNLHIGSLLMGFARMRRGSQDCGHVWSSRGFGPEICLSGSCF